MAFSQEKHLEEQQQLPHLAQEPTILYQLVPSSCLKQGKLNVDGLLLAVKWVNTEWKQVAADRHELQSITNFLSPRHCYDFRSLEY